MATNGFMELGGGVGDVPVWCCDGAYVDNAYDNGNKSRNLMLNTILQAPKSTFRYINVGLEQGPVPQVLKPCANRFCLI